MRGWLTVHQGEGVGMPRVFQVALPSAEGGVGQRRPSQTSRDERLFREAWFADFRSRWQRDLAALRAGFWARMAAL